MLTQDKSKRKPSGGRFTNFYVKKVKQIGNAPIFTKIGLTKRKNERTKGGAIKTKIASIEKVNLYDPKTKKYSQVKLKTILENKANRHFIRRNILTKGCVVDTEKGKATITSRPGQSGSLNAVLNE